MNNMNTRGMAGQQGGAALAIGLILLLAMSVSGVYIMNSSIMDERMTANQRSQINAFLAAEAGLLAAQKILDSKGDNWNAGCAKGETISNSAFDTGAGNNDAQYTVVFLEDCDISGVPLQSTGVVSNTGVRRILTARYQPSMPIDGPGNAPAAISCLGGGCNITPGAGQAMIDGRDHLPSSSGPIDGGKTMPSLYFSNPEQSYIDEPKGQFKFCGKEQANEGCSKKGKDADTDTSKFDNPSKHPADKNGNPTHPTAGQFFDSGTPIGDLAPTSHNAGTRDKPTVSLNPTLKGNDSGAGIMIIDGENVTMSGNPSFEGLIVIRNCGTLNMSGNPTIYGAIIVDASQCDDNYAPFGQNGTPTVAYSVKALNNAGSLLPSHSGRLLNWQEDIHEGEDS